MYTLIQYLRVQPATAHTRPTDTDGSDLFHAALRDPSNLELDWLWLAGQVSRASEQAYCLRQALRINPHSAPAQRGLAQLERQPATLVDFTAWSQAAFRNS
jgi:hypothetical protein